MDRLFYCADGANAIIIIAIISNITAAFIAHFFIGIALLCMAETMLFRN